MRFFVAAVAYFLICPGGRLLVRITLAKWNFPSPEIQLLVGS